MLTMPVRTKDERVELRVDTADLERWRATADAEGLTLSNWIRKCCNDVALSAETIRVVEEKVRAEKAKKGRKS